MSRLSEMQCELDKIQRKIQSDSDRLRSQGRQIESMREDLKLRETRRDELSNIVKMLLDENGDLFGAIIDMQGHARETEESYRTCLAKGETEGGELQEILTCQRVEEEEASATALGVFESALKRLEEECVGCEHQVRLKEEEYLNLQSNIRRAENDAYQLQREIRYLQGK